MPEPIHELTSLAEIWRHKAAPLANGGYGDLVTARMLQDCAEQLEASLQDDKRRDTNTILNQHRIIGNLHRRIEQLDRDLAQAIADKTALHSRIVDLEAEAAEGDRSNLIIASKPFTHLRVAGLIPDGVKFVG